jgi:hypothetical protein
MSLESFAPFLSHCASWQVRSARCRAIAQKRQQLAPSFSLHKDLRIPQGHGNNEELK